jgi:hypothetical protein
MTGELRIQDYGFLPSAFRSVPVASPFQLNIEVN